MWIIEKPADCESEPSRSLLSQSILVRFAWARVMPERVYTPNRPSRNPPISLPPSLLKMYEMMLAMLEHNASQSCYDRRAEG